MDEKEWLSCKHPRVMLESLREMASNRKLRLFACGFCRRIADQFTDVGCWRAVEVAEQYADELATAEELQVACVSARLAWAAGQWEGMLAAETTELDGWRAASGAASCLEMDDIPRAFWEWQTYIIRDIFGNPFRPQPRLEPACLAWNEGCVRKMAQVFYDDRAFYALPLLADALEDAGCTEPHILAHCRSSGPHVRGCWAVDLVLGRK